MDWDDGMMEDRSQACDDQAGMVGMDGMAGL